MSVTDLSEWRRDRAAHRARDAGHPVASGGPHAAILGYIAATLVPQGYRDGLWTTRAGKAAHAVKPLTFGYSEALCGAALSSPRRAEPAIPPCKRCFPS